MYVFVLCLWLIFVFGLLIHLFKKYLYADLFNKENIEKRKIEIQKQKEYYSKNQLAINLPESDELINKFNWAAFIIPGLWCICYKTWEKLLICFIPIPFVPNIIFGINGNKWALSKFYGPLDTYILEQKVLVIIGIISNLILIPMLIEKFSLT